MKILTTPIYIFVRSFSLFMFLKPHTFHLNLDWWWIDSLKGRCENYGHFYNEASYIFGVCLAEFVFNTFEMYV